MNEQSIYRVKILTAIFGATILSVVLVGLLCPADWVRTSRWVRASITGIGLWIALTFRRRHSN
jgi:hypothetical protein